MSPKRRHLLASRSRLMRAQRSLCRRLILLILVMGVVSVSTPTVAVAQPTDQKDLSQLPDNLRKYVVDSAGWYTSPWMTSPTCKDKGGDWSVYVHSVISDTPDLLMFFLPDFGGSAPEDQPRKKALLDGYRDLGSRLTPPPGFCVDDMRQWAGSDPTGKPFGFLWGDDVDHNYTHCRFANASQIGTDRAPCYGFYVSCAGAEPIAADKARCDSWNSFSDDYVQQVLAMQNRVFVANPATAYGVTHTEVMSPEEAVGKLVDWVAKKGMEQLVAFVVENIVKLWGVFVTIAVDYSSPTLQGKGFTDVYNLVGGIVLALAFLGFLITLITSYKRGYLQYSLLGAVKAVIGVPLAAVGAILMLQLADECTISLAQAGGDLTKQADWTASMTKVNPFVAVISGTFLCVFLLVALVFLVAIGPLVMMWTLFGSVAAAGQVHPATSGWLVKWAARITALCWTKFFMIAIMLLVIALFLPLNGGDSDIRQVIDVLQGIILGGSLVATPYLLWELVDFVGERVGGAASGGSATQLAAAAPGTTGNAIRSAVGGMMSGAANVADKLRRKNSDTTGPSGTTPQPQPSQPRSTDVATSAATAGGTTPSATTPGPQTQQNNPGDQASTPAGVPDQATPPAQLSAPKPPANRGRVVASTARPTPPPPTVATPRLPPTQGT